MSRLALLPLLALPLLPACFTARAAGGPALTEHGLGWQAKVGAGMGCCLNDHAWFVVPEFGVEYEPGASRPILDFGGAIEYHSLRGARPSAQGLPYRIGFRSGMRFQPNGEDDDRDHAVLGASFALFPWRKSDTGGGGGDGNSKSGPLFDIDTRSYRLLGFEATGEWLISEHFANDGWLFTIAFVIEWTMLSG
jgi:hypothetical protein